MSKITTARAIETLKKDIDINQRMLDGSMGTLDKEAKVIVKTSIKVYEKAIEALEKQIPQQAEAVKLKYGVMIENTAFGEGCTIYKCKRGTFIRPMQKYCSECGQLIKWEVEANG